MIHITTMQENQSDPRKMLKCTQGVEKKEYVPLTLSAPVEKSYRGKRFFFSSSKKKGLMRCKNQICPTQFEAKNEFLICTEKELSPHWICFVTKDPTLIWQRRGIRKEERPKTIGIRLMHKITKADPMNNTGEEEGEVDIRKWLGKREFDLAREAGLKIQKFFKFFWENFFGRGSKVFGIWERGKNKEEDRWLWNPSAEKK